MGEVTGRSFGYSPNVSPRRVCIGIVLSALIGFCLREISVLPDGKLHLYVLGKSLESAALVITPSGHTAVIDTGSDTSILSDIDTHLSLLSKTIDLLVLTHPDAGRIGAMEEFLKRYGVRRVLLSGSVQHSPAYDVLLHALAGASVPVLLPDGDRMIDMGDGATVELLWPKAPAFITGPKGKDEPIVLSIHCGSDAALFLGKIDAKAENAILASGRDVRSRILVTTAQGGKTAPSTGFLLAIAPSVVVLSPGNMTGVSGRISETVQRYAALSLRHYVTDKEETRSFTLCAQSHFSTDARSTKATPAEL